MANLLKRYRAFMLAGFCLITGLNFAHACDIHSVLEQQRFEDNLQIKQRAIRQCLAEGARISDLDDNGFSILSVSIILSDFEALHFLLQADVDPDLQDADGRRPLQTLVQRDTLNWSLWKSLAERLIASGAEINATDQNGDTALHYAALLESGTDRVRFLLDHAADPNIANQRGQTPLFSTLQGGCQSGPGLALLNGGARLDAMDEFWVDMLLDVSAMLCSAEGSDRVFASRLRASVAD